MSLLRKLFKRKLRVTFHMKSGAALLVKCDKISTKVNGAQDIISYSIEGGSSINTNHYIRLDDISAITVKK